MEQDNTQPRRMYPDRHYAQANQQACMPRQQYGENGPRQPVMQNSRAPPQQQRGPRPGPGRFPVNANARPDIHHSQHAAANRGHDHNRADVPLGFEPPRPAFHQPSRHMSHISELSSTYAGSDSRPISAVGSEPDVTHSMSNYNLETPPPSYPGHSQRQQNLSDSKGIHQNLPLRDSETLPHRDNNSTVAALSAAIRAGLAPSQAALDSQSKDLPLRMPFQGEPESPTSIYTDITTNRGHVSMPFSSYQGHRRHDSKVSTISEQDGEDPEKSERFMSEDPEKSGALQPGGHPATSRFSDMPVSQHDQSGLSSRVPESKRPPRLDIVAVREAEARGSMTSLSDLIRRATKVASNLDRGKTASRLGHLDMFGSSDKLDRLRGRNSTYSDVLAAFPAPTESGTPGKERPNTMWPNEKGFAASKSSLGRFVDNAGDKPRRKCCGLSPPFFVLILVMLILLVVAAVLIPIFLIVIPKQNQAQTSLTQCPASHTCHNGGVRVFNNNMCSCICVDGYTGSDCSSQADPDCGTGDFADGAKTWTNATIGNAVLPVLQEAEKSFGLPLNSTLILSTFAYNNLSCVSENSLVLFGSGATPQRKRLVVVPELYGDVFEANLDLPAGERESVQPTPTLQHRQEATQSSNGIVFAHSSVTATSTPVAPGPTSTSTSTASGSLLGSTGVNATQEQVDFAGAVVLYVLQSFSDINIAVSSKQAIDAHFGDLSSGNGTVEVVSGGQGMQADFDTLQILLANGTIVGHS